jgi:hypothetical protein
MVRERLRSLLAINLNQNFWWFIEFDKKIFFAYRLCETVCL